MNKTCPECGDRIIGREDKKFCSDGCRNAFNNKINKDSSNLMRTINNRLRKNYRILTELNSSGTARTTRGKLTCKGFDFNYFTSLHRTSRGNTYYFLYDHGYGPLENEHFKIIRKEP